MEDQKDKSITWYMSSKASFCQITTRFTSLKRVFLLSLWANSQFSFIDVSSWMAFQQQNPEYLLLASDSTYIRPNPGSKIAGLSHFLKDLICPSSHYLLVLFILITFLFLLHSQLTEYATLAQLIPSFSDVLMLRPIKQHL